MVIDELLQCPPRRTLRFISEGRRKTVPNGYILQTPESNANPDFIFVYAAYFNYVRNAFGNTSTAVAVRTVTCPCGAVV